MEYQAIIFGDSIKFEGLLSTDQGWIIVTSQDFVEGQEATNEEIADFFDRYDFQPVGDFSFERILGDLLVTVRDARPANIRRTRLGHSHRYPDFRETRAAKPVHLTTTNSTLNNPSRLASQPIPL